ncbi:hypothetical protein B0T25DRAFT_162771 [Lasiosphaeria hispida]|uniref:Uncharacterized protein n=1 Tax=Lasiosphaeria hispida TaxID=260671 RepID=A0AAJ0HMC9_9PEZI|nr:hypothetical protein B0T25DRAFT_162771 [Lasiosphaeria hispida]
MIEAIGCDNSLRVVAISMLLYCYTMLYHITCKEKRADGMSAMVQPTGLNSYSLVALLFLFAFFSTRHWRPRTSDIRWLCRFWRFRQAPTPTMPEMLLMPSMPLEFLGTLMIGAYTPGGDTRRRNWRPVMRGREKKTVKLATFKRKTLQDCMHVHT